MKVIAPDPVIALGPVYCGNLPSPLCSLEELLGQEGTVPDSIIRKSFDEALICCVCHELPLRPFFCREALPSLHTLCGRCMKKVQYKTCPICSIDLEGHQSFRVGYVGIISPLLDGGSIVCPNQPLGCQVEGGFWAVLQHIAGCGHTAIRCACGQQHLEMFTESHRHFCPEAVVGCPHCMADIRRKQMADHLEMCGGLPLLCKNGCGEMVVRRETVAHRSVCGKVEVPCVLCGSSYPREDLVQHHSDPAHVALLMDRVQSFQDRATAIKKKGERRAASMLRVCKVFGREVSAVIEVDIWELECGWESKDTPLIIQETDVVSFGGRGNRAVQLEVLDGHAYMSFVDHTCCVYEDGPYVAAVLCPRRSRAETLTHDDPKTVEGWPKEDVVRMAEDGKIRFACWFE